MSDKLTPKQGRNELLYLFGNTPINRTKIAKCDAIISRIECERCEEILEIEQQDPRISETFGEQLHLGGRKKLLKEIRAIARGD